MTKKLETVQQAMLKAKALAKKGDTVQAARLYQAVLARFPNNRRAADALAALRPGRSALPGLGQRGVPTSAEMAQIIAHLNNRKFAQAIKVGQNLKQKYPNAAEIPNLIGAALAQSGDLSAAVTSIRLAIALRPNFVDAYFNLANALYEMDDYEQATAAYSQVLKLHPGHARAQAYRAQTLFEANLFDDAITDCHAALRDDPKNIGVRITLGKALLGAGMAERSRACFAEILDDDPGSAKALTGLGNALKSLGNIAQAIENMTASLARDPMQPGTHLLLSTMKKFDADDPQIGQLDAAIASAKVKPHGRAQLYFARAKADDDLGNTDRAFANYQAGNRQKNSLVKYDPDRDKHLFTLLKSYFSDHIPSPLNSALPRFHAAARPIFIVGMPRSGTTLTEQILASHSDVYGAGELRSLGRIVPATVDFSDPAMFALDSAKILGRIRSRYFADIAGHAVSLPVFTDKLPLNFRWIGFILLAFPEARIVHLQRDPMAVCWSIYRQLFASEGNAFGYDQVNLGQYYRLYLDLMAFWRRKFPGRIFDLDYDALTRDQAAQSRRLLEYCDLKWQDSVLDFHLSKRPVATASATQVRRKMYQGSSQAWRRYQQHLRPLSAALNGEVDGS